MKKAEMIEHWKTIEEKPLQPAVVPYKHEGSTYDQDGIRITGSQDWIDAVLYRLRDLLQYENGETRLQVVYKESQDRETGAPLDSWNCYVQVHERGGEAKMMNAFLERIRARKSA
jgi:hypothetical protein